MFDGLDRLPSPDKFWAVVDQDLRAMRLLGVGVIATAPQSLLHGEGRAIAAHFDRTHQIRALSPDPESNDLKTVLVHRGGMELMDEESADMLCGASGGVLRDLITLARDAGEEAWRGARYRPESAAPRESCHPANGRKLFAWARPRANRKFCEGRWRLTLRRGVKPASNYQLRRVLEYSATEFRVHPTLPLLSDGVNDRQPARA